MMGASLIYGFLAPLWAFISYVDFMYFRDNLMDVAQLAVIGMPWAFCSLMWLVVLPFRNSRFFRHQYLKAAEFSLIGVFASFFGTLIFIVDSNRAPERYQNGNVNYRVIKAIFIGAYAGLTSVCALQGLPSIREWYRLMVELVVILPYDRPSEDEVTDNDQLTNNDIF